MKGGAINSSPNMDKGNTALILGPFLDGMRDAGADVEVLYTKKLNVNPCQGELHCWTKTPGECFQKDDVQMVLTKMYAADVWVIATPLYVDGMTGPMKNLLDRMIPGIQPFFEVRDGHCRHPRRWEEVTDGKVVLVSNCGFWEMDNFDPLVVHMNAICRNVDREFAGALLRPHGPALGAMKKQGMPVDDVFDAAKEAGRQMVETGQMSTETLETVGRDLLPLDMYIQLANQSFQRALDGIEKK